MQHKKVIILVNYNLSHKFYAAYSRLIQYAKGLTYGRDDVSVYLISLKYFIPELIKKEPSFPHVYIAEAPDNLGKTNPVDRYFDMNKRKKRLKKIMEYFNRDNAEISYLVYPFINTWYEEKALVGLLKKNNHKVYSERNERALGLFFNHYYPSPLWKKLILLSLYPLDLLNAYMQDKNVKLYEGNIVISTAFERWITKKNSNCIRIPILTDISDGEKIKEKIVKKDNRTFRMAYTGSLSFKKDGIDILLKTIKNIVQFHKQENIRLSLYGYAHKSRIAEMEKLIESYAIGKYVNINMPVSSQEIKKIQSQQDCLLLVRRKNMQNQFGFSTKLAEYMLSGAMVIVSDVSDNAEYITNGINGFIVQPDADSLARTILDCMNLKEEQRQEIGRRSIHTAQQFFNIENYAYTLQKFILP